MSRTNDYSEALACLRRVVSTLDEARLMAGRVNLPPVMNPASVSSQIEAVDDLIALAQAEVEAARQACTTTGRAQFRVIK